MVSKWHFPVVIALWYINNYDHTYTSDTGDTYLQETYPNRKYNGKALQQKTFNK